jgi:hypothetical protein
MFEDTALWMMLSSMAGTAGLLGFWLDRSGTPVEGED